jgi:hypothetical protein
MTDHLLLRQNQTKQMKLSWQYPILLLSEYALFSASFSVTFSNTKSTAEHRLLRTFLHVKLHREDNDSDDIIAASRIKLVSLDVKPLDVDVLLLNEDSMQEACLPLKCSNNEGEWVSKTHVTVAYCQSSSQQIKAYERFAHLIGSQVNMSVSALLMNDQVAALAVEVASETAGDGSGVIPRPENAFPHITIWVANNESAYQSNQLFELFEGGQAKRLVFSEPSVLTGTLSFWGQDNESLSL